MNTDTIKLAKEKELNDLIKTHQQYFKKHNASNPVVLRQIKGQIVELFEIEPVENKLDLSLDLHSQKLKRERRLNKLLLIHQRYFESNNHCNNGMLKDIVTQIDKVLTLEEAIKKSTDKKRLWSKFIQIFFGSSR